MTEIRIAILLLLTFFGLTSSAQVISTFPHFDDLETWDLCGDTCSVSCVISSAWSNTGNVDFRTDTNGTPTAGTGPSEDHNPGTTGGVYAYVEHSDTCVLRPAFLESPFVDLNNVVNPGFSFWRHNFGATVVDTILVEVTTDSGATWSLAGGLQNIISSDTWVLDSVDLNPFVGNFIKLRIGYVDTIDTVDFAVDDFTFYGEQYVDASIGQITASGTCSGDSNEICVQLVNAGLLPIDSVYIFTTLNGGALFSTYQFNDSLGPGEDTTICLGTTLLNDGDSLVAYTSLPNGIVDTLNTNDTFELIIALGTPPSASAGNDTTICTSDSVQIGGSPTSGANTSFNWSPGALCNDSTLANPIVAVSQDTQLIVLVTDTLTGCTASDTIEIVIYALPAVDAGMDTVMLCATDTATLGGNPTTAATNSVVWSPSMDLDDSTSFNPLITINSTYFIVVTVTEPVHGCQNTDAVLIISNTLPVVNAGGTHSVCLGDSVTLGGTPTSSLVGSYQWTAGGILNDDTLANPVATPTQDTTIYLTVTSTVGCSDSDSVYLDVHTLPTAAVNYTPVCFGDTTQLMASGGLSYAWGNSAFLSDDTLANPLAFPPQDTFTYGLTVTDVNGCIDSLDFELQLYPLPKLEAGNDDTLCNGSSELLGASGASTYIWTPATGLSNPNIANPVASPTTTTTYHLEGTSALGCVAYDSLTVYVNLLPNANAGPDTAVCAMDSVQIGGNPTGPSNSYYDWQSPYVTNVNASNPNFLAPTTSGFYTVTVTVTDANNCSSSDQVQVQVYPTPNALIAPITNTICIGESINISATGGIFYLWSPASSLASATSSQTSAYPIVTTIYTVTVTDGNGCTSTDSKSVNVFPLTPADAGADVEMCLQGQVGLNASGGVTYQWGSTPFLDDLSSATPVANPVQTQTFTVTVTDGNGCTETDDVEVTVHPLPIVSAGENQTICLNESVQIGGDPTGPTGSTYEWTPSTGLITATDANPSASPPVTTEYTIEVTSDKGCKDIDKLIVFVDSLPVVEVIDTVSNICRGDTSIVKVTKGFSNYEWGPKIAMENLNADSLIAYPSMNRIYTVTVTDRNGCKGSTDVEIKVNQPPTVTVSDDYDLCIGDSIKMSADGGATYAWSDGQTLSDSLAKSTWASPTRPTKYVVSVTDTIGCSATGVIDIRVYPLPVVDAGDDIDNCEIDAVYLGGANTGPADAVYYWSPETGLSDRYSPNPLLLNPQRADYYVLVQDRNGCFNTDTISVNADCYSLIYAPSAFTPGSNDINDKFYLEYYRILEPKLQIFNRWGKVVFETDDLDIGWDGVELNSNRVVPSDVYYWVLTYKTEDKKKESKEGTVTLLK